MKMPVKISKKNKSFDSFFILALLCMFAVGVLLTVIFCVNAYKSVREKTDYNFNQITPLSYIATKVRQFDASDAIRLDEKDGTSALVIKTLDGNEVCETWIYNYEGYIYEIYIDEKSDFSLSDGIAIFENSRIEFSIDDNKALTVYNYGKDEIPMKLTLGFRSSGK